MHNKDVKKNLLKLSSVLLFFFLSTASFGKEIDLKTLPLGNNKWSDTPKKGYVFACEPEKYYSIDQTGAKKIGPWVASSTWNKTEKISVLGEIFWPEAKLTISTTTSTRNISTNNLPNSLPSGVFPVSKNDPAYQYDSNPNKIEPQNFSISVPLNPEYQETPSCVKLPVAIGLDGVVFFSALDSHGRDEPAYEIQDKCEGMSAPSGIYHRYLSSSCWTNAEEENSLLGYALDGFGIYTPYTEDGKELTTADLDECHGTTSPILWDGRKVNMYHYVLTKDFPYSVSCFRGTPEYIEIPPPPSNFKYLAIILLILILGGGYWIIKRRKNNL